MPVSAGSAGYDDDALSILFGQRNDCQTSGYRSDAAPPICQTLAMFSSVRRRSLTTSTRLSTETASHAAELAISRGGRHVDRRGAAYPALADYL